MEKEVGGLGVRRIREFNLALLGKWCWRMVTERNRMWFNLLAARYGHVGRGLVVGRGRRGGGRLLICMMVLDRWWVLGFLTIYV